MMRIFIAFDIPNSIRDILYDLQKELHGSEAKIKLVEKKNLHCTLKFLGEIDDDKIAEIDEILKKIRLKNFTVNLGKVGVFPNMSFIRVVYIELIPSSDVIKLQQAIDSELLALFQQDARFQSHMTLGRVKFVKDKEKFNKKISELKAEGSFDITEFKLYKSVLTKDGPNYETLKTYKLY